MFIVAAVPGENRLAEAELRAACLDGELFALGDGFATIDSVDDPPALRARAIREGRSSRMIAELETAAWIWGAAPVLSSRRRFCATPGSRAKTPPDQAITLREVVLDAEDVVDLNGSRVTSPLRTAVDLARFGQGSGQVDAVVLRRLADVGRFGLDDAIAVLNRRPNLPAKRRALQQLSSALQR